MEMIFCSYIKLNISMPGTLNILKAHLKEQKMKIKFLLDPVRATTFDFVTRFNHIHTTKPYTITWNNKEMRAY